MAVRVHALWVEREEGNGQSEKCSKTDRGCSDMSTTIHPLLPANNTERRGNLTWWVVPSGGGEEDAPPGRRLIFTSTPRGVVLTVV